MSQARFTLAGIAEETRHLQVYSAIATALLWIASGFNWWLAVLTALNAIHVQTCHSAVYHRGGVIDSNFRWLDPTCTLGSFCALVLIVSGHSKDVACATVGVVALHTAFEYCMHYSRHSREDGQDEKSAVAVLVSGLLLGFACLVAWATFWNGPR